MSSPAAEAESAAGSPRPGFALAGRADAIGALLQGRGCDVHRVSPGAWRLARAGAAVCTVRFDAGWLVLRRTAAAEAVASPAELLRRHAALPGLVQYSTPTAAGSHLYAEIPVDVELAARLHQVCAVICADAGADPGDGAGARVGVPPHAAPVDLEALCSEAGWACTTRPNGALAIELQTPDTYGMASVARRPGGACAVSIDLAGDAEPVAAECGAALAIFLLRVGNTIRLVRAASADETSLRLEVVFPTPPAAVELNHALAALSVAWGLCSREAEVLRRDVRVAQAYLVRSPWQLVPGP